MLELEIDHEAVTAFWDRITLELEEFAPPSHVSQFLLEVASRLLFDKLANNPVDVFEFVALPATRAGKHTLGFRISRAFEADLALAAKDGLLIRAH
ncbi:hypothetical protein [Methylopila turkensis]|uniref:hypothetical protein n=1 Tax=Methylopila turkensis TaxID=1437816 RepID=UPI0022F2F685|nr:hypothetical protein [Methylopila turkensis]